MKASTKTTEDAMKKTITIALALAPLGSLACSPGNLSGEVDGEDPPSFQSAFTFTANRLTDVDDHVAGIAFYTFPNACEQMTAMADVERKAIEDVFQADDLNDVEGILDDVGDEQEERLPDDYWAAYALVGVEDEDDVQAKHDINETAQFLICHHTGPMDMPAEEFVRALEPDYLPIIGDDNRECFFAEDGEVRVSFYDANEAAIFKSELELAAVEDGESAGDIEIGGTAARCPSFSDSTDRHIEKLDEMVNADASAAPGNGDDSCRFAFDNECDDETLGGTGACEPGTDASDCG
jgi:hypothetical protein